MDTKDTLVKFNNSFPNACADIKSNNIMKYVTGNNIKYSEVTLAGTSKSIALTNKSGAVMANGEQLVTREYLTDVFIPKDITLITTFELNNEKLEEKLYYTDFIINKNIQVNVTNSDPLKALTCRLYADFDTNYDSVKFTETARQILRINVIPLDYLYSTMNINLIGNSILELYFYDAVTAKYVLYKTYSNPLYSFEMFNGNNSLTQTYEYFYSQTASDVEKWNAPGVFHAPINFNYVPIDPRIVGNYKSPPASYNSIASNGQGLCVAVGVNIISRSADNGDTWTTLEPVTYPIQKAIWTSITYGDGLFVALGDSICMISLDGLVWTEISVPKYIWKALTYAKGLFVGVGNNEMGGVSVVITSTNGKDWINAKDVPNGTWESVTYGGDLFLAVGCTSTGVIGYVMKSSNGLEWKAVENFPSGAWVSVTYGDNKFVAVSSQINDQTNQVKGLSMYSDKDGENWSLAENVPNNGLIGITYGNNKFIATGYNFVNSSMPIFMSSNDGINWKQITVPYSFWGRVIYSSDGNTGKFICGAISGEAELLCISYPQIITSIDGDIWTVNNPKSFLYSGRIVYGSGLFLSLNINYDNVIPSCSVLTSRDANLWSKIEIPFDDFWNCIIYGGGLFVSLGGGNGFNGANKYGAIYSSDGIDWKVSNNVPLYIYTGVTYGAGLFVAVGYSIKGDLIAVVIYSKDAKDWTLSKPLPNNIIYRSIGYGNNLFVAVGDGLVMYSKDAITWTLSKNVPGGIWRSLVYEKGLFVAVGDNGISMYSENGITWTSAKNVPNGNWGSITYGEGLFVSLSYDRAMKSIDGKNWSYIETFDTSNITGVSYLQNIVYGNNKFVASGNYFKTIKP
jgi:hypothetical protein